MFRIEVIKINGDVESIRILHYWEVKIRNTPLKKILKTKFHIVDTTNFSYNECSKKVPKKIIGRYKSYIG